MSKMKALVKLHSKPGLWMDEADVPEPGINDILIKIKKTGICGTDLHIYKWDAWAQKNVPTPMVIGHEFAGTIEKVGSNVHGFEEGELVSGEGHLVCGFCRNCQAGRKHLCANTAGLGVNRMGAFAEYVSIPAANVWLPHAPIAPEILAYFDPLGNATHTALTFDMVGEDVLITGAGPIGLMAIKIARHIGARHIVITDVNKYRLELAKKLGVSRAVDVSSEKLEDVQEELGMKEGFDVGLEMSGNPSAFESMLANMCHGGKVALLGILPGNTSIDWDQVIFKSLTVKGIYGRQFFETWYKMTSLIASGLDVTEILTHRFRVNDFEKGFEIMSSGNCGKVVLDWE